MFRRVSPNCGILYDKQIAVKKAISCTIGNDFFAYYMASFYFLLPRDQMTTGINNKDNNPPINDNAV